MAVFHWINVCGGHGMKIAGVKARNGPPSLAGLEPSHVSFSPTLAKTTRTFRGRSSSFVKSCLPCSMHLKINHATSSMISGTSCWGDSMKFARMTSMRWNYPHRCSERRRRREIVDVVNSATLAAAADDGPITPSPPLSEKLIAFQKAFWKFLRPHTIRGTILGSMAVTAKALLENPTLIDWALLPRALLGVLALLCGNGYIVGINQIYDVDIDAVNKPFLPVAAGELSPVIAWILCGGLAAAGLAITIRNFGPLISKLYGFGLFLGTIYSVPPLRLKRSAFAAFLIIATVRGFLLNFGVYHAVRAALGLSFQWNPAITFITIFVTIFATVIAITKDLPDVEGDRKFGIETFATRLGVRRISFLGSGLLLANYIGAIAAAIFLPHLFNPSVMIPSHALLGTALLWKAIKLDAARYTQDSIAGYYRFIWNLFYLEYLILPFL